EASSYYGGLYTSLGWGSDRDHTLTCLRCEFMENAARYGAGAVGMGEIATTMTQCQFIGNTALGIESSYGGAIHSSGQLTLQGCILAGNRSAKRGGGIYGYRGHVHVSNCTFIGNRAQEGRAVAAIHYEQGGNSFQADNTIFWDDANEFFFEEGTDVNIAYCDIQGAVLHWAPIAVVRGDIPEAPSTTGRRGGSSQVIPQSALIDLLEPRRLDFITVGPGNIAQDPGFVDPGYWDLNATPLDFHDDLWFDGDYHLKSQAGHWEPELFIWLPDTVTSPCIDAGDPNAFFNLEPIPHGHRINMGAYGGTAEASLSMP
ncbi:MAG: right-handed parallel beta-helix repeat-containing protein, partial [Bacteroidales bacterium]|nr:right-handed parallel beta-helix repeat-containing protein [Bacteroidales bacterium]